MKRNNWPIYTIAAFIAVLLISAAVFPSHTNAIMNNGVHFIFLVLGIVLVIIPDRVREHMAARQMTQRQKTSVGETPLFWFRVMGVFALYVCGTFFWNVAHDAYR